MRALRALAARPGFTAASIVTLALGLAVNAAIFSLTRDLVLRPLPYPNLDRLVAVYEHLPSRGVTYAPLTPNNYAAWRTRVDAFDATAPYRAVDFNVSSPAGAVRAKGFLVGPDFFSILGVAPALGRLFVETDAKPGRDDVVVLSDGFWRRHFNADPSIVGRRVIVDGTGCTIVGVLPASFRIYRVLNRELDLWRPFVVDPTDHAQSMLLYARLRPGVSIETANAQMSAAYASLPAHVDGWTADVSLLSVRFTARSRSIVAMLEAAVGIVLLIACANVANLLLAVSAGRRKELAVRTALGASAARIARDLAGETALVCAAGALLGVIIALWIVAVLNSAISYQDINRLEPFRVDLVIGMFTTAVAAAITLALSVLPARQAAATDIVDALKDSAAGMSPGVSSRRLRQMLVVGEIALSIVVLTGAFALGRSARTLVTMPRGIDTEHVMTAQLALNGPTYDDPAQMTRLADRLTARLESAPELEHATITTYPPLSIIGITIALHIDGRSEGRGLDPYAQYWVVSPRYFETLRIPILEGRDFNAADRRETTPVAIVSRRFAERFWGRGNPIGREITPLFGPPSAAVWIPRAVPGPRRVVGVVEDVREDGIPGFADDDRLPQLYLPYSQTPTRIMTVVVRSRTRPETAGSLIRQAVRDVDPDQPTFDERTLDDVRLDTFSRQREMSWLVGLFAALALALAAVGVYALVAYLTTARAREIGIRVALGAARRDVVTMIVADALKLATAGAAIGICLIPAAAAAMRSFLFGVALADVASLVPVVLTVLPVATAAAAIPAIRAANAASTTFR